MNRMLRNQARTKNQGGGQGRYRCADQGGDQDGDQTARGSAVVVALVLGAALLLAVTPALAQDIEIYEPPPEAPPTAGAPAAAEPADDALQPSAFDLAWRDWSRPLWCALLENDDPLVRVLASLRAELRSYGEEPLSCAGDGTAVDARALREDALRAGGDAPALLARVFVQDCAGPNAAAWCDEADLVDRLLALDPGNAYPHLLALQGPGAGRRERPLPFSSAELEHLLGAASSDRVDGYLGSAYPDTLRAIGAAVDDLPPLRLEADARAAAKADDIDPSRPADLAAAEILLADTTARITGVARLYEGCRAGSDNDDDIAVRGCRALGELMERAGRSDMMRKIGADLVAQAAGEDVSAGGAGRDDAASWRRRIPELMRVCGSTRGLPTEYRLPGPMPEDHVSRFFEALENRGERAARLEAAGREFARYPEAFPVDPRRCEDIARLDATVQRGLAERWSEAMTGGPEAWDRVLKAAARALDAR